MNIKQPAFAFLLLAACTSSFSCAHAAPQTRIAAAPDQVGAETSTPNLNLAAANQELDFAVLATGSMSDYEGGRAAQLVGDANELRRLWSGGNFRGDVPAIDFATRSVIFVRQGQQSSGGYRIGVRAVRRTPSGIVLEVDETRPAPGDFTTQVITSPFVVISVPRVDPATPVRFADGASSKPGREPQTGTEETIVPRQQTKPVRRTTPRRRRPRKS